MNQVERARRFAHLAYSAALADIVKEFSDRHHAARVRAATNSKTDMFDEEAKLQGEWITATIKAQLDTLLDGYELNGVAIDEEMAATIAGEVSRSLDAAIHPNSSVAFPWQESHTVCDYMKMLHLHEMRQHVGLSPASIRAEIDRRRLAQNSEDTPAFALHHVAADKARVYVTKTDNSVSTVIRANQQLFADIRQKINCCLREGTERKLILEKLAVLELAQNPQSFAQRYSDFISAAANHILLLTPFNPVLTEMLHRLFS